MESVQDALHQLHVKLNGYNWYAGKVLVNSQLHNSVVAYVKYMNQEVEETVPLKVGGFDVRVHFASSLCEDASKFVSTGFNQVTVPSVLSETNDEVTLTPALDLHHELWKLRRVCGAEHLTDIFYEVHDGPLAITNVSVEYPEVRSKIQELYDEYGFDVLFEELDN